MNVELNQVVEQFEEEWSPECDWREFLPDHSSENFAEIASEVIRVDLEFRWLRGCAEKTLDQYLNELPSFSFSRSQLGEIAFEEFRVRSQTERRLPAQHYSINYGVDVSGWPTLEGPPIPASKPRFPETGSDFHGFELVAILGQGAFGRVYLARQQDLANRFVALKVTGVNDAEPQALARLQHTSIVPIHSLRREGNLQSVCMPFLGFVTFRDLIGAPDRPEKMSNGRSLLSTVASRRAETVISSSEQDEADNSVAELLSPEVATDVSQIHGMDFQQMVLWIGSQVADGLAYSHSRGIVHGDIKPANILVTDDGQPLLLDFHLATGSSNSYSSSVVGGTFPYMSARQLRSLFDEKTIDEYCDIFSLGVVLFEALTGEFPYPDRGVDDHSIHQMIEDRKGGPRRVRDINSKVSVDASTIVEKCLGTEGGYDSCEQLFVDLQRHIEKKPLLFASNKSVVERCRKWISRHPRLTSASFVSFVSILIFSLAALLIQSKFAASAKRTAEVQSKEFVTQISLSVTPLTIGLLQPSLLSESSFALNEKLNSLKNDSEFIKRRSKLDATQVNAENQALTEAAYWQSRALFTMGLNSAGSIREDYFRQAKSQIDFVHELTGSSNRSLARLVKDIGLQLGEDVSDETNQFEIENGIEEDLSSYLPELYRAAEAMRARKYEEADEMLESLCEQRPSFQVWLLKGHNCRNLGRLNDAIACYGVCRGFNREIGLIHFFRGLAYLEQRRFKEAKKDFDRTIALQPMSAALLNRALAFQGLRDYEAAVSDLDEAIEIGISETRAHYVRYRLLKRLKRDDEAQKELEKFLQLEPTDEKSWLSRGIAQTMVGKPEQALADFKVALAINPRSTNAYQNIATVQAQYLNQTEDAIVAMTEIISKDPSNFVAIATRGVLNARVGNRVEAHSDAKMALKINRSADALFRVAGIYALTTKIEKSDSEQALGLLNEAAFNNAKLVDSRIHKDDDLNSVKSLPEFQKLVEQLKDLSSSFRRSRQQ